MNQFRYFDWTPWAGYQSIAKQGSTT